MRGRRFEALLFAMQSSNPETTFARAQKQLSALHFKWKSFEDCYEPTGIPPMCQEHLLRDSPRHGECNPGRHFKAMRMLFKSHGYWTRMGTRKSVLNRMRFRLRGQRSAAVLSRCVSVAVSCLLAALFWRGFVWMLRISGGLCLGILWPKNYFGGHSKTYMSARQN